MTNTHLRGFAVRFTSWPRPAGTRACLTAWKITWSRGPRRVCRTV